jgi:hypothetical protein
MTEFDDGYDVPFTMRAGIPLKWMVRVRKKDLTGCSDPMIVP